MTGLPASSSPNNNVDETSSSHSRSSEQSDGLSATPSLHQPDELIMLEGLNADNGDEGRHNNTRTPPRSFLRSSNGSSAAGGSHYQHQHHHHHVPTIHTHSAAWDVPPLVASPHTSLSQKEQQQQEHTATSRLHRNEPLWKERKCRPVTPQHLASIFVSLDSPPQDEMNKSKTNGTGNEGEGEAADSTLKITMLDEDGDKTAEDAGTNTTTPAMEGNPSAVNNEASASSTNLQQESATCSCPPILWNEELLIMALVAGEIRVYGNLLSGIRMPPSSSSQDDPSGTTATTGDPTSFLPENDTMASMAPINPPTIQTPLASLIFSSDASIVQLIPILLPSSSSSSSSDSHKNNNTFLALSVEGHVYQFRLVVPDATAGETSHPKYTLELEHSWKTGSFGATCMAVVFGEVLTTGETDETDALFSNQTAADVRNTFSGTDTFSKQLSSVQNTFSKQAFSVRMPPGDGFSSSSATPPSLSIQSGQPSPEENDLMLLVGYTSGYIECWKIHLASPSTSTTIPSKLPLRSAARTPSREPSRRRPKCAWKGLVEEPFSVMSLQVLLPPEESSGIINESSADEESTPILMATLQTPIGDEPPVLHAFDLAAIHLRANTVPATSSTIREDVPADIVPSDSSSLPLPAFRVLPDPAMGLIELTQSSTTFTTGSRNHLTTLLPHDDDDDLDGKSDHNTDRRYLPNNKLNSIFVPGRGANRTLSLSQGEQCGISMANGTVAILSSGWGVSSDADQLLLSFPAIGLGRIVWRNGQEYLVCCLRAGTCYLIPTKTSGTDDNDDDETSQLENNDPRRAEIIVINYPHDLDSDTTNLYVQEFTAGSLRTTTSDCSETAIPVLIFVWPGGVIDIYACELVTFPSSHDNTTLPSVEDQVLLEMIQQGCLEMTLKVLEQQQQYHADRTIGTVESTTTRQKDLWNLAKEETNSMPKEEHPFTLEGLKKMPALRSLLLHLAAM